MRQEDRRRDGFESHNRMFMTSARSTELGVEVGEDLTARTVVTAFQILDLLSGKSRPVRLAEIVRILRVPKTSAIRVLRTLCDLDAVDRDPVSGGYELGPHLLEYAYALGGIESVLVRRFHPVAARLREQLDETVQLAVLSGTDVTFVAKLDSTRAVRLVTYVGRQLPAHATAVGKAILAFSSDEAVQTVLAGGLERVGPRTITEEPAFLAVLERARRDGWASESEESAGNLSCFASPILDVTGTAVAGLTVCVPSRTIPSRRRQQIVGAVVRAAAQLSATAGRRPADS